MTFMNFSWNTGPNIPVSEPTPFMEIKLEMSTGDISEQKVVLYEIFREIFLGSYVYCWLQTDSGNTSTG